MRGLRNINWKKRYKKDWVRFEVRSKLRNVKWRKMPWTSSKQARRSDYSHWMNKNKTMIKRNRFQSKRSFRKRVDEAEKNRSGLEDLKSEWHFTTAYEIEIEEASLSHLHYLELI